MTARPILVTGSPRGGTTWVGKILAEAPRTVYLSEPFRPNNTAPGIWTRMPSFSEFVTEENATDYEELLEKTLGIHYSWRKHYDSAKGRTRAVRALLRSWQWAGYRLLGYRPVMKDPIALFSAEWLASRFDMDVVVTVRHPAAFAGSIKLKGWRIDYEHLLTQRALLDALIGPFEDEIRAMLARDFDQIDHAILIWRIRHHVISSFSERHPEWLVVRNEDLSRAPMEEYQKIFDHVGLRWTRSVEAAIDESTKRVQSSDGRRSSLENIVAWKKRLTPEEIERIRVGTSDVAGRFYGEEDW